LAKDPKLSVSQCQKIVSNSFNFVRNSFTAKQRNDFCHFVSVRHNFFSNRDIYKHIGKVLAIFHIIANFMIELINFFDCNKILNLKKTFVKFSNGYEFRLNETSLKSFNKKSLFINSNPCLRLK
jgi:hypothetical protein